jgi:ABC-2 type transport system ATP-binding protein
VRTLGTLIAPTSGSATVAGIPLTAQDGPAIRSRISIMPESPGLYLRLTVMENLQCFAGLYELDDVRGRIHRALRAVHLEDRVRDLCGSLSKGLRQRVALARALLNDPAVLFLDEPTSGLDPNGVLLVRDLIGEQKARGAAVLLNSHQLAEVEKVCDRVLFLHGGVIAREETLRHVDRIVVAVTMLPGSFDAAAVARLAGATPDGNAVIASVETEADVAELVRALVASGAGVIDVRRHTADLEEIFRGAK